MPVSLYFKILRVYYTYSTLLLEYDLYYPLFRLSSLSCGSAHSSLCSNYNPHLIIGYCFQHNHCLEVDIIFVFSMCLLNNHSAYYAIYHGVTISLHGCIILLSNVSRCFNLLTQLYLQIR